MKASVDIEDIETKNPLKEITVATQVQTNVNTSLAGATTGGSILPGATGTGTGKGTGDGKLTTSLKLSKNDARAQGGRLNAVGYAYLGDEAGNVDHPIKTKEHSYSEVKLIDSSDGSL